MQSFPDREIGRSQTSRTEEEAQYSDQTMGKAPRVVDEILCVRAHDRGENTFVDSMRGLQAMDLMSRSSIPGCSLPVWPLDRSARESS